MNETESANAVCARLLKAISDVDEPALRMLCDENVSLQVPGARAVDLTAEDSGIDEFVSWAANVQQLCGQISFNIHRYFKNDFELMASGAIHIQRNPRTFSSPCSALISFEGGKVVLFQLLLDTFALEKFRGQMD